MDRRGPQPNHYQSNSNHHGGLGVATGMLLGVPSRLVKLILCVAAVIVSMVVSAPVGGAATPLADCTANLNPRYSSWTAQCTAPHMVTIRFERWWHWLGSPTVYYTTRDFSRQVEPGAPWSASIYYVPEQITVQVCLTAYQDSTVLIAPRVCG
jgi:hypothetical protein